MDLSILSGDTMEFGDDSFLFIRSEEMDDEVTQIFKKWKLNNPTLLPTNNNNNNNNQKNNSGENGTLINRNNETFDSRTFTRPTKRRTFNMSDHLTSSSSLKSSMSGTTPTNSTADTTEMQSIESGIASINLQVGGVMTPLLMQKSWLLDVSPPSSICTSMDFQNTDNMLNSLITSSDFTNVSFLLNGTDDNRRNHNNTITIDKNATLIANNPANINNVTRNLMDFTFTKSNSTFVTSGSGDSEPPLKEIGIENVDIQLNESTEDFGKNLTFNKYDGDNVNLTWDKIQSQQQQQQQKSVVQSTPVHNSDSNQQDKIKNNFEDDTLSPISSFKAQLIEDEDEENLENEEILLRSTKSRRLIDQIRNDEYRNSMEDQCEFLLNEETIKLSSRVCGKDSTTYDDKHALITSSTNITITTAADLDHDEREFDKMLDSFNVKKSIESEKLLQSVDSIKQRHSLINMEKQREGKQSDNKVQYDAMMNKSSERLLNRRSRLYDDVNLQLQKQQQSTTSINGMVGGGGDDINNVENNSTMANGAENENEVCDKNDRDRFKTIKLNKPRLQTGMIIIDTEEPEPQTLRNNSNENEVSPGTNKERQNQLNQQKQGVKEENEFKKPSSAMPSKLSKFGFGLQRPSYSSRNNLNLPLKANSTDSLDNDGFDSMKVVKKSEISNLKLPMGVKSKSIHNLMYNGAQQSGIRMTSNLKLSSEAARSQSNLKAPPPNRTTRASSLVRPSSIAVENGLKIPQNPTNRKTSANLVRPSSGYYGNAYNNTKRLDSDSESYSLSSSSASSRNSVHLSLAPTEQNYNNNYHNIDDLKKTTTTTTNISGAIPKPGFSRPIGSGLPRPTQLKSGLPRPSFTRR